MKRLGLVLVPLLAACAAAETPKDRSSEPSAPPAQSSRTKPGAFTDPFAPSEAAETPEAKPEPRTAPKEAKAPEAKPAPKVVIPAPEPDEAEPKVTRLPDKPPAKPATPKAEAPKVEAPKAEEPQDADPKGEAPKAEPRKLEKGTIEPSDVEAGNSSSAVTPPELTDEQIEALPRVQILRGLLAQKERRLADTLRDLAAARQTNVKEQVLSAQTLTMLQDLRAQNTELERKLALASAGMDPTKARPSKTSTKDPRFLPNGPLDPLQAIGKVNGERLLLGDLLERLYFSFGFEEFKNYVRFKLVEQEANRRGIPIRETETLRWAAKKMAEMAAKAGGEEKFRKLVKQEGKSLGFIDAALRNNAAFVLRINRLVAEQRTTPEGRKALEAIARQVYADEYDKVIEASHIFYRAKESDTKAVKRAREKAEIAVNRISRREAAFEVVARAESEDENSREEGGDLGKITPKRFDDLPAFNRVLFSLPKGRLSVVQSKVGLHVVRINKVVPPSLTWAQAKPRILRELARDGATAEETAELLNRLDKAATIERDLRFR